MGLIDNFNKLNYVGIYLLIKTLFLFWAVRIMLWVLPFSTIEKFVKKITVVPDGKINSNKISIEKITWAVIVMGRYVPKCTCLTRALTAHILLSKQNYCSNIKLGVNKDNNDRLNAHAWLEIDNKIVLGESNTEYVPIRNLGEKIQ